MFSKRAQSEVITTILIILLVLAAIIIVWQVVKGTMDTTEKDIANKKLCLGSQLSIVKAVAGNGTCNHNPLPPGVQNPACNVTVPLNNNPCQNSVPGLPAGCVDIVGTVYPNPVPLSGQVIVTREPSTGNEDTVKARVFVDDTASNVDSGNLAIYGKVPIPVTGLKVGASVKVAALLNNGNLCPATDTVTAKSP